VLISWLKNHQKFPEGLGSAFLVGFEYARHIMAISTGGGYDDWTSELYRHPGRQSIPGELLEDRYYQRYHDVYSFGVVLLELGRWKRLEASPDHFQNKTPTEIKQVLLHLSANISPFVGSRYVRIVRKCLEADVDSPSMTEILGDLEDLKV
jgi:serine/threonine protein kinase